MRAAASWGGASPRLRFQLATSSTIRADITGVPKGIWRFMENLGEMTKVEEGVAPNANWHMTSDDAPTRFCRRNSTAYRVAAAGSWSHAAGPIAPPRPRTSTAFEQSPCATARSEDLRRINRERPAVDEHGTGGRPFDHPLYLPARPPAGSLHEMKVSTGGRNERARQIHQYRVRKWPNLANSHSKVTRSSTSPSCRFPM